LFFAAQIVEFQNEAGFFVFGHELFATHASLAEQVDQPETAQAARYMLVVLNA
jgi:hypothetical protein